MPKNEIDYSNTIIYKITCKDTNIKDVYVGHTTNFVQRKHTHKQTCINSNSDNYKCKLYSTIRDNGGWQNWTMEIINFCNCKDHYEARKKEQEYFISLGATLNSIEPLPKPKVIVEPVKKEIYVCNICNVKCSDSKTFEKHNATNKHLKYSSSEQNNSPNSPKKFVCELCQYSCCKKSDMDKHFSSQKHICNKQTENGNIIFAKPELVCKMCNKSYKSRVGLWRHTKTCVGANGANSANNAAPDANNAAPDAINATPDANLITFLFKENADFKNMILEVVKSNTDLHKQQSELQKQNSELQKQVLEVCKNTSNININQTNSNNKTFNLQFFLNEQCKDAMNISDFVNSFDLQLSDLESVGDLGYVEGMTKIFLDKLNTMDIYKRPIHCSDTKREILYVKDEDKWEKEKRSNPKLRDAIKHLSFKNMKLTNLWSNTYPESKNNESRLNDVYMKLVLQSTGGSGEIVESENKIIRRIAKEVFIDKNSIKL